jgi:hypothetical protein
MRSPFCMRSNFAITSLTVRGPRSQLLATLRNLDFHFEDLTHALDVGILDKKIFVHVLLGSVKLCIREKNAHCWVPDSSQDWLSQLVPRCWAFAQSLRRLRAAVQLLA